MTFTDLPAGATIFVDANTLVYHFQPHPLYGPACTTLVKRIELQEITTHVQSEVAHRLMTLEAMKVFGWPATGIAQRLRKHPVEVQRLTEFRQAIETIPRLRIQVLTIAALLPATAAALSQQFGLLSNDALIVAAMQAHGMSNLVSHDADFDRVPGLTRYAPV